MSAREKNEMHLRARHTDDIIIFEVRGTIGGSDANRLWSIFRKVLDWDGGDRDYVVNLCGTHHIDTAGMSALVAMYVDTVRHEKKPQMAAIRPKAGIWKFMRISNVGRVIQWFPEEKEATHALVVCRRERERRERRHFAGSWRVVRGDAKHLDGSVGSPFVGVQEILARPAVAAEVA